MQDSKAVQTNPQREQGPSVQVVMLLCANLYFASVYVGLIIQ